MFERARHRSIARILDNLDGPLLRTHACYFAGGTAIALQHGEYRESMDIDFLVSDKSGYRALRGLLTSPVGVFAIAKPDAAAFTCMREVRADQYGLRTLLTIDGIEVKFEIVHEARIELAPPESSDELCGVPTLCRLDQVASKLLANSDRWADEAIHSRDLIDLAMLKPARALLQCAIDKAAAAYGASVTQDLKRAIDRCQQKEGWLDECMRALAMTLPRALMWQNISALEKQLT